MLSPGPTLLRPLLVRLAALARRTAPLALAWPAFACAPRSVGPRPPRPVPERFERTPAPLDSITVPRDDELEDRIPAVARLELPAPARSPFLLHGTIPLPDGAGTPEAPPRLAIVERGGTRGAVPAQVEVVSRGPDGRADVVEVIAQVRLHPSDTAGRRVRFDVVLDDGDPADEPALPLEGVVRELFQRGDGRGVKLRARDVHDNLYEAELTGDLAPGAGSSRTLADGRWLRRLRTYATMVPIDEPAEEDPAPRRRGEERKPAPRIRPGPPLPHLFGVHAYWTQHAGDNRVGLDLRVNNGACSGSRPAEPNEEPLGFTYFQSLELVLPKGWFARSLVRDPFLGRARSEGENWIVPLVRPFRPVEEGALPALHVMGPQAQMHRRLTLAPIEEPSEHLALEGLAFSVDGPGLWSWYSPDTARYSSHRGMLCTFEAFVRGPLRGKAGLAAELLARRDALRNVIETGGTNGIDVVGRVMGWAHPWFVKVQGGTGGGGIMIYEGHLSAAASSPEGVERLMLLHRMNVSRQPQAMFDRRGDFVGFEEWVDESGVVPFDFRTNGGMVAPVFKWPSNGGPPASPQVRVVKQTNRRPPYDQGEPFEPDGQVPSRDDNLWSWAPHDGQHMIRYTKHPKALVWLANDPLAKDDLYVSGETFHLQFHEALHRVETWSQGVSLRVYEKQVTEKPGVGLHLGRDQAWGIDAMVATYSVASPEWRARHLDWFRRVARLLTSAAMPSGIIMRNPNPKILGHDRYEAAQSYQSLFLVHAMRGLDRAVLRGVHEGPVRQIEKVVLRTLEYLYWGPVWAQIPLRDEYQPKDGQTILMRGGPREAFAVAQNDQGRTPPFCDAERWGPDYIPEDGFAGGVEFFHCWSALEYGALISEDRRGSGLENRYMRRLLSCWTQPSDHSGLLRDLFDQTARASSDNSGNWAGLAGRIQALMAKR